MNSLSSTVLQLRSTSAEQPCSVMLRCARNVYAATSHRMPEARPLANWVCEQAFELGVEDTAIPDDEAPWRNGRGQITAKDWQQIGTALEEALARRCPGIDASATSWLTSIRACVFLDELESDILGLAMEYESNHLFESLFDSVSVSRRRSARLHNNPALFALLIAAPVAAVVTRLAQDSKLHVSGLLRTDKDGNLQVLDRLIALVRRGILPDQDIYDQLIGAPAQETLSWDAFAHLGDDAEIAASMLQRALAEQTVGINILLYGPPGTGKTCFAATLASHAGANLRSIGEENKHGGMPSRSQRLAELMLAQRITSLRNSVLLFDEAEDLLAQRSSNESEALSRVFVHRLLERTRLPVIWTANDLDAVDPAILRRMTMCLRLGIPGVATRTRLWGELGRAEGISLSEADAASLARLIPAAPAVAATALRAARLAGGQSETARRVVEGIARAIRHGDALPPPERFTSYDPALISADCDLAGIEHQLTRAGAPKAVSFLLSGPPGTGKSAWVRHLAERMGLSVLHKRASDLLGKYVGDSERNIAEAFAEARESDAFLVFDEADSLLFDRADAVRSWEITQVNEMLTWMENHALPFACTTNFPDRLDPASLRRFLVKVRFDWLSQPQARLAFQRFFEIAAPPALNSLRTLTPADFALVHRRAELVGVTTPDDLVRLLEAECEGRKEGVGPIGFTAGCR
ncbi:MAG: ATP-binding protein [Alphaproteobacteria bacterium]|nr:ATP-binding protein [Alphaproteobacteria bacterium]